MVCPGRKNPSRHGHSQSLGGAIAQDPTGCDRFRADGKDAAGLELPLATSDFRSCAAHGQARPPLSNVSNLCDVQAIRVAVLRRVAGVSRFRLVGDGFRREVQWTGAGLPRPFGWRARSVTCFRARCDRQCRLDRGLDDVK